jgi:hypothetical protein
MLKYIYFIKLKYLIFKNRGSIVYDSTIRCIREGIIYFCHTKTSGDLVHMGTNYPFSKKSKIIILIFKRI